MNHAPIVLAILGAVVWLAIFISAAWSRKRVEGLRAAAVAEIAERLQQAEYLLAVQKEQDEPSLPTLSPVEAMQARWKRRREAVSRQQEKAAI